jgi:hypothetical protein
MRFVHAAAVASLSAVLFGCPVHQSPPARAQEAATELNVNTRFGRMELATERVAPDAQAAFLERRRAWGANIRVADYELASFHMFGDSDAEMLVRVAWYRVDQGDLRTTTLKQKWHDFRGDWKLVDEARSDGDVGLIGEATPPVVTQAVGVGSAPRSARFPTIRLGAMPDAPTAPATILPPEPSPEDAK